MYIYIYIHNIYISIYIYIYIIYIYIYTHTHTTHLTSPPHQAASTALAAVIPPGHVVGGQRQELLAASVGPVTAMSYAESWERRPRGSWDQGGMILKMAIEIWDFYIEQLINMVMYS